ncbi:uncharacterized protein LOC126282001 [Schistocerca gregaria]|uniref:uncharacterized protein LOC126282001 n=1 Tax=Schistocerca gregaria TaxID=7010 RepID=UPI00211E9880|nr:uncharacterized protein LOC126282001 [Schistocerca gregaria]
MTQRRVLSRFGSAILLFCALQVEGANDGAIMKRFLSYNRNQVGQKLRVANLKYNRCGPESDPGRLDKLEITSTPSGDVLVTLSASTDVDLEPPVQVTVEVYKRLF